MGIFKITIRNTISQTESGATSELYRAGPAVNHADVTETSFRRPTTGSNDAPHTPIRRAGERAA